MNEQTLLGILVVSLAGLFIGSGAWPMKLIKTFQFEHWWLVGMFTGLFLLPWAVTLLFCPNAFQAFASVPTNVFIKSNLWAAAWGGANVLCGICFVRIGVALTGAVLTGLGVSVGVTLPMIVKGSGLFQDAANLTSPAGLTVMAGVAVMLIGVVFASVAGFGRDQVLKKTEERSGNFLSGLLMCILAGIMSAGISLAFVYAQGPIVEALKAQGAGDVSATFGVWATALVGGSLVNVIYPAWLITSRKSWNVLFSNPRDFILAVIIGINFAAGIVFMGNGMLMLGALGASVGFGIQQASQMLGGQGLGFLSGEWKGVHGTPRRLMYAAIGILIVAAIIMAMGNTQPKV
jgi:L-rhamnose-H+ transport protein